MYVSFYTGFGSTWIAPYGNREREGEKEREKE
jgi:hypothetical protein